jgi:hypothetical protein
MDAHVQRCDDCFLAKRRALTSESHTKRATKEHSRVSVVFALLVVVCFEVVLARCVGARPAIAPASHLLSFVVSATENRELAR